MNKKRIGFLLLLGVVGLMAFMLIQAQRKITQKKQIQENIQSLPDFTFYHLADSTAFTNKALESSKGTVLVLFNSSCEHCQYEATQIKANYQKFAAIQLLMVSTQPIAEIKAFAKEYQLEGIPSIRLLKADPSHFYQTFGSLSVPSIFIYDTDQQLVKTFKGEVKIEKLLEHLP